MTTRSHNYEALILNETMGKIHKLKADTYKIEKKSTGQRNKLGFNAENTYKRNSPNTSTLMEVFF